MVNVEAPQVFLDCLENGAGSHLIKTKSLILSKKAPTLEGQSFHIGHKGSTVQATHTSQRKLVLVCKILSLIEIERLDTFS